MPIFEVLGMMFNVSRTSSNDIFHYWLPILRDLLPSSLLEEWKKAVEDDEFVKDLWLSRTYGYKKNLYLVGWVRHRVDFDENTITFGLRRNSPFWVCSLLYFLHHTFGRASYWSHLVLYPPL